LFGESLDVGWGVGVGGFFDGGKFEAEGVEDGVEGGEVFGGFLALEFLSGFEPGEEVAEGGGGVEVAVEGFPGGLEEVEVVGGAG
jgi:hypothetical protein